MIDTQAYAPMMKKIFIKNKRKKHKTYPKDVISQVKNKMSTA